MSFKLPELLNPVAKSDDAVVHEKRDSPSPSKESLSQRPDLSSDESLQLGYAEGLEKSSTDESISNAPAHEAADTLAYLANSSGPPAPRSIIESPTAVGLKSILREPTHYHPQEYSETLSANPLNPFATPVEPSSPNEPRRAPSLSGLDQYHHQNSPTSQESLQQQHRETFGPNKPSSPSSTLPPIRSTFFSASDARMTEPPSGPTSPSGRDEESTSGNLAMANNTTSQAAPKAEASQRDSVDQSDHAGDLHPSTNTEGVKAELDAPKHSPQPSPDEQEHSFTHHEPVTAQIRQPSPRPSSTPQEASMPSPPLVQVKAELSATPRAPSPSSPLPPTIKESDSAGHDSGAEKKSVSREVGEVKDEASIKAPSTRGSTLAQSAPATTTSTTKQGASKKRAAPKSTSKKGTASTIKKPAAKKRRLSTESVDAGRSSKRSATPASSRASKGPANRKYSATPLASSPGLDEEDAEDDGQVFCICRRPDNHTWMIACDGGCDDWFHGKCVKIKEEDGDLIDRYVCPNCSEAGYGHTSWKPMCRLDGCRKPARLSKKDLSKYCSDEHGREFMHRHMLRIKPGSQSSTKSKRSRGGGGGGGGGGGQHETTIERDTKGGVLKPSELSTLATSVTSMNDFRRLGESILPLSPPQSVTNTSDSLPSSHPLATTAPVLATPSLELMPSEALQLSQISTQKAILKDRRLALQDRERFTHLIKDAARRYLETTHGGQKAAKDLCGYDPRLAWSDHEFDDWRLSERGRRALLSNSMDEEEAAPPQETPAANGAQDSSNDAPPQSDQVSGPTAAQSAVEEEGEEEEKEEKGEEQGANTTDAENPNDCICARKRCERHKQWLKVAMQDLRFEEANLADDMRRLDREEGGIRERAALRALGAGAGANLKEGSVEVVS